MKSPPDQIEGNVASGEPAFIRRLPAGVEYTHIKTIFIDLPSRLTMLLWLLGSDGNPLHHTLKERTVRAIDRALNREENEPTRREHAAAVRRELVELCLQELHSRRSSHPGRWIEVALVSPQWFAAGDRPPGPSVQHLRITVHHVKPPRGPQEASTPAVVLEQRFLTSEPSAWNASIPFIDPEQRDRIIMELVRKHIPRLMSVRVSARWRSNHSPEGWRLVTQHVVPELYDYLKPFYPVRRHRRVGRDGPGHYPVQLRRDIVDIVRFELRPLADKLTVERVTASIQRHIARRHSTRRQSRRKRPEQ